MTIRRRRWIATALALVLAAVVLAWTFDGNWVRPALERHLSEASGRRVHFDDLQLGLDRHLDVNVRLRGIDIANAPWADTRDPMATVGEARFSMSLRSVWERRPVVSRLVILDGRLDLQRQADGLRNWRLTHPDDRGPGRVIVQSLEAQRTRVRFAHRGQDLELTAEASPSDDAQRPTLITFLGRYRGERFGGEVATGPEVTIQGTGRAFPMRGHMTAAGSKLDAEGRVSDFFRQTGLEGRVHVETPSLARLRSFLRAPLPESKPFTLDAELKKERREYTFARVKARVGRTPIEGELAYDVRGERQWVKATLQSDVARWEDVASLLATPDAAPEPAAAPAAASGPRPLRLSRLDRLDAQLDVTVRRLVDARWPALGGVRLKAAVDHGRLDMSELAVGLGHGELKGRFTLAAHDAVPRAEAQLSWAGVRIEDLLHAPDTKRVTGLLDGRVALRAEGDSVEALKASTTGQASATLRQGTLAKRLDAELGLDGARLVGSLFSGDKPIAVRCAAVAFDVAGGVATARTLALSTTTTQLAGTGRIDLRDGSLALTLTPEARDPGLLTLERSIALSGPIAKPKARLIDRVALPGRPEADAACGPA